MTAYDCQWLNESAYSEDRTRHDLEALFFASANQKTFENSSEREAFKERWLGAYLDHQRDNMLIARNDLGQLIGYLAGCLESSKAWNSFEDPSYDQCASPYYTAYPAHFHVNIRADHRHQGLGRKLVSHFLRHCAKNAVRGVHVVTSEGAAAVEFYKKCGLQPLASADWQDRRLLILALKINCQDMPQDPLP